MYSTCNGQGSVSLLWPFQNKTRVSSDTGIRLKHKVDRDVVGWHINNVARCDIGGNGGFYTGGLSG